MIKTLAVLFQLSWTKLRFIFCDPWRSISCCTAFFMRH